MKKLFISQPMRNKTDEKILKERKAAVTAVESMIDSFFEAAPHDAKPLWFLGKSIELLTQADIAYFTPGWKDARGCKIEHECAVEYGIDRID